MATLYLIAHKVRGEPAFDIAERMACPVCEGGSELSCTDCEDGFWWIIPTSGHRAYPYWEADLEGWTGQYMFEWDVPEMPPDLPDHYPHSAEPAKPKIDVSALVSKKPSTPIRRRA